MQKTAYEMRISDWSSDVCSSDLSHLDRTSRCRLWEIGVFDIWGHMRASRRAWQNCGKRSKTRFLAGMVLLLHSGSSPGADMSEDTRKRTGHEPTLPLIIGALISLTVISLVIGHSFELPFRIKSMTMKE